ncbi:MAG: hypothetical protein LH481_02575 [Burkholderiales bacterium]|nr:hypothetical protein [Burkholderiales bacterium]
MKSNKRMVGAVVVGLTTWLLATYFQTGRKHTKKLVTRKLAKEAVQSWEGEGGAIIDPLPRASVG